MKHAYFKEVNLELLYGDKMHPGSGHVSNHMNEINIFRQILDDLNEKSSPVMIEVGGFWSLWSLMFKRKYSEGKSIIIELGKRQLDVGKKNFELNNMNAHFYHGGFFINSSQTFRDRSWVLEYNKSPDEIVVGPELNFFDICKQENVEKISILHMDIQGSEMDLILSLESLFKEKKVNYVVVGTHSNQIHETIENVFKNNQYMLKHNIPFTGNDGLIVACSK